jgi:type I restriction enzyme S subunit
MGMNVGFKQTEVGIIPQTWEVKSLGQIGTLEKGKGLLKEDVKTDGSIPAIPYTALYTDFSELLDYQRIKWFVDDASQTYIAQEPCVLIASSSNMAKNTGKASALRGTTPVAIGREVIVFKTSSNPVYISYLLSTAPYRQRTLALARGTTIKHVYPATFVNYEIGLPPSPEQTAIANALSDADALIESLEELLAKKRQIKQGAMQELLTGKRRLPGFRDAWKLKPLGSFLAIRHGKSQHEVEAIDGQYPILATGGAIGRASAYLWAQPSVLIGRKGTIDRPQYMDAPFWSVDTLFYSDVHAPNSAKFLFYRFCLIQWKQYNEASGVPSLNAKTIEQIEIEAPQPDEQAAIASVLTDIDREIQALEEKLTKARQIKQGMMQELLTGRIRLV